MVAVLCVAVEMDDEVDSYYDIVFANGVSCSAISGYHLAGIHNWK